jgi:hypothetical protein
MNWKQKNQLSVSVLATRKSDNTQADQPLRQRAVRTERVGNECRSREAPRPPRTAGSRLVERSSSSSFWAWSAPSSGRPVVSATKVDSTTGARGRQQVRCEMHQRISSSAGGIAAGLRQRPHGVGGRLPDGGGHRASPDHLHRSRPAADTSRLRSSRRPRPLVASSTSSRVLATGSRWRRERPPSLRATGGEPWPPRSPPRSPRSACSSPRGDRQHDAPVTNRHLPRNSPGMTTVKLTLRRNTGAPSAGAPRRDHRLGHRRRPGSSMVTQTKATRIATATRRRPCSVADAGVQQAVFMANKPGRPGVSCAPPTGCSGSGAGGSYRWSSVRCHQTGGS